MSIMPGSHSTSDVPPGTMHLSHLHRTAAAVKRAGGCFAAAEAEAADHKDMAVGAAEPGDAVFSARPEACGHDPWALACPADVSSR